MPTVTSSLCTNTIIWFNSRKNRQVYTLNCSDRLKALKVLKFTIDAGRLFPTLEARWQKNPTATLFKAMASSLVDLMLGRNVKKTRLR